MDVKQSNIMLGMDQSIAVGMVISELVSNAFKHAFCQDGEGGKVSIGLSVRRGSAVQLIVEDNGIGLPCDIDMKNPPSLGLKLVIATVTRELGGEVQVEREGGTRFIINFECKNP